VQLPARSKKGACLRWNHRVQFVAPPSPPKPLVPLAGMPRHRYDTRHQYPGIRNPNHMIAAYLPLCLAGPLSGFRRVAWDSVVPQLSVIICTVGMYVRASTHHIERSMISTECEILPSASRGSASVSSHVSSAPAPRMWTVCLAAAHGTVWAHEEGQGQVGSRACRIPAWEALGSNKAAQPWPWLAVAVAASTSTQHTAHSTQHTAHSQLRSP
jgi:hypothetical protein